MGRALWQPEKRKAPVRAIREEGMEFQQGLAIVLRAFNYGYIVDSWGDAPYTAALNGAEGEQEDLFPVFDSQETIYRGIITELEKANDLLSKSARCIYRGLIPMLILSIAEIPGCGGRWQTH